MATTLLLNYKLLVCGQEGEHIDNYSDFYIDDVQTLQEIKKQWVFKNKSKVSPCGYGYSVVLVDDKAILKKTLVNIDCEYMSGWIYFPKAYLEDHKGSFKKMTDDDKRHFSVLPEMTTAHNRILPKPGL